jgi:hypothetical protein
MLQVAFIRKGHPLSSISSVSFILASSDTVNSDSIPTRPHAQVHDLSYVCLQSSYVRMIVEANVLPWQYNILASTAHWILLVEHLVMPGTFTSLQKFDVIHNGFAKNGAGELISNTIKDMRTELVQGGYSTALSSMNTLTTCPKFRQNRWSHTAVMRPLYFVARKA